MPRSTRSSTAKKCSRSSGTARGSIEPDIQNWPLTKLHPHPLQDTHFCPLKDHEFEEFVADIQRRGLDHEVHILPANAAGFPVGTLVQGHQRVRAAQRLGWKTIRARVRHDLADKTAAEIEQAMISDNFVRRQLTPLQQAKLTQRLYEIELGRDPGDLFGEEVLAIRERVGRRIDRSEKTVKRHLDVLRAPVEVQQAFEEESLKIELASRVCRLPDHDQAEIAERLRAGECPKQVVAEYLKRQPATRPGQSSISKAGKLLRQAMEELPVDYETTARQCGIVEAQHVLSTLERLQPVVATLSAALVRAKQDGERELSQYLADIGS